MCQGNNQKFTLRGSGVPSATGTPGHPAISHYPFAPQKEEMIMNIFKNVTKSQMRIQVKNKSTYQK